MKKRVVIPSFRSGVEIKSLCQDYLVNPDKYVYPFEIKEPDKVRTIITYNNEPSLGKRLRRNHENIAHIFEEDFFERNNSSFAYHKGVRCLDALESHLKSNFFIKLDIHHFFESITEDVFFEVHGEHFNKKWREVLKYVFYKGSLSIGFVTSPLISDFFMSKFDRNVEKYIQGNPLLHYSRYSDDILLSTEEDNDNNLNLLFDFIKDELEKLHLEINEKKTRKVHLEYEKRNSVTFLGLNLSKADEVDNKITISKRYTLFLLFLIEKNNRYDSRCRELVAEINSRVAYLAYNSPVSFNRFQKKHFNKYGFYYDFVPKEINSRRVDSKTENIKDFSEYAKDFDFNIHAKVVNENNGRVIVNDGVEIIKYKGNAEVVTIPKMVNSIGRRVFSKTKVKKVILNDGINAIRTSAFFDSSLEEIYLPKSLVYIEQNAFANTKLNKINIPVNLRMIPAHCFDHSLLEEVTFAPDGKLDRIDNYAIANARIRELVLPNSVKKMESFAFANNPFLAKISFGEQIITIPQNAFSNCHALKEVKIPETVLSIEDNAFMGCFNLKKISLSKNLVSLSPTALSQCAALTNVEIDPDNKIYASNGGKQIIERSTKKLLLGDELDENVEILGNGVFDQIEATKLDLTHIKEIGDGAVSNTKYLKEVQFSDELTSIGASAFERSLVLKKIELPDSLEKISLKAFKDNLALEEVKLPKNLKVIDKYAFAGDANLKKIEFPESLEVIDHNAFASCLGIKEIHIGPNVKKISPQAFNELTKSLVKITVDNRNTNYSDGGGLNILIDRKKNEVILGCVNSKIPEGIKRIGKYAFAYIEGLKEMHLPSSLEEIDEHAFDNCRNLTKVNLDNVFHIKAFAFRGCLKLTGVAFPSSLVSIGKNAFEQTALKEAILPNSLINIEPFAFAHNLALTSIELPDNLSIFNRSWFDGCLNIKNIKVHKDNPFLDSRDDCNAVINTGSKTILFACKNTVIPETVKRMHPYAFVNYKEVSEIKLPEGFEFSLYQFSNYYNLKKVNIPKGNTKIPSNAFSDCISLESIEIPYGIKFIGNAAFKNCVSLKEIEIPDNVDSLEREAFANCRNLKTITFKGGPCNSIFSLGTGTFIDCVNLENIIVPKINEYKTVSIGDEAFKNCHNLKTIPFDNRIPYISNRLFYNCEQLKLNLSDNITALSLSAFYNVPSVKEINLGKEFVKYDPSNFSPTVVEKITVHEDNKEYCSSDNILFNKNKTKLIRSFNSGVIPEGVTIIDKYAFAGIKGITEINIPASVKTINSFAFAYMPDLKKVIFKGTEVDVGSYAFTGCQALEEVKANGVYHLGSGAFLGCSSLKKVDFPFVKSFNSQAFGGCKSIEEIHISFATESIVGSAFDGVGENLKVIKVDVDNAHYSDLEGSNVLVDQNGELIKGCSTSTLKEGITSIGDRAFQNVKGFKDLKLPEGLTALSNRAFDNCDDIENVYLPSTLNTYGGAFVSCHNIKSMKVHKDNLYFKEIKGNLISKANNQLLFITYNSRIDESVSSVSPYAFDNAKEMTTLYVPRQIYGLPFSNLKDKLVNLNKIEVDSKNPLFSDGGNCITNKDKTALIFAMKDSNIPDSVKTYRGNCFIKDESVKNIFIPKNVTYIAKDIYDVYINLETIEVDKDNKVFSNSKDKKALLTKKDNKVAFALEGYKPDERQSLISYLDKKDTNSASYLVLTTNAAITNTSSDTIVTDGDLPF